MNASQALAMARDKLLADLEDNRKAAIDKINASFDDAAKSVKATFGGESGLSNSKDPDQAGDNSGADYEFPERKLND